MSSSAAPGALSWEISPEPRVGGWLNPTCFLICNSEVLRVHPEIVSKAQEPAREGIVLGEPLKRLFALYLLRLRLESAWGERQTQPELWCRVS